MVGAHRYGCGQFERSLDCSTKLVCQLALRLYMQFNRSATIKRWVGLLLAKFGHYQSGLHFVQLQSTLLTPARSPPHTHLQQRSIGLDGLFLALVSYQGGRG